MIFHATPNATSRAPRTAASVIGMHTVTSPTALPALHEAVARAARNGASYQWIAGVLAGVLTSEITTADAQEVAIRTLTLT